MRLQDRVAIITGGAEGIGRAYALGFAREGARVTIADINLPAAEALVNEFAKQGHEALAIKTDVSKAKDVGCHWSAILSVANWSGKMSVSVNGRTDIECERAEQATCVEWGPREAMDDCRGSAATWGE